MEAAIKTVCHLLSTSAMDPCAFCVAMPAESFSLLLSCACRI